MEAEFNAKAVRLVGLVRGKLASQAAAHAEEKERWQEVVRGLHERELLLENKVKDLGAQVIALRTAAAESASSAEVAAEAGQLMRIERDVALNEVARLEAALSTLQAQHDALQTQHDALQTQHLVSSLASPPPGARASFRKSRRGTTKSRPSKQQPSQQASKPQDTNTNTTADTTADTTANTTADTSAQESSNTNAQATTAAAVVATTVVATTAAVAVASSNESNPDPERTAERTTERTAERTADESAETAAASPRVEEVTEAARAPRRPSDTGTQLMALSPAATYELDKAYKSGWLRKRGGKRYTQMRRRFFVCRDAHVFYYKTEIDTAPTGFIPLDGCSLVAKSKSGGKYPFDIVHASRRTFVLEAESEADREDWMMVLSNRIVAVAAELDYANSVSGHAMHEAPGSRLAGGPSHENAGPPGASSRGRKGSIAAHTVTPAMRRAISDQSRRLSERRLLQQQSQKAGSSTPLYSSPLAAGSSSSTTTSSSSTTTSSSSSTSSTAASGAPAASAAQGQSPDSARASSAGGIGLEEPDLPSRRTLGTLQNMYENWRTKSHLGGGTSHELLVNHAASELAFLDSESEQLESHGDTKGAAWIQAVRSSLISSFARSAFPRPTSQL